jgi:hypothetical protein
LKRTTPKNSARPNRVVNEPLAPIATITVADRAEVSWWTTLAGWCTRHPYLSLTFAVIACLVPFSGRAFHVDDTLFVWAAQQIAKHPLDPYGFEITWDATRTPMSDVTQNPPLASYYLALIARFAGWSERALHLGFLLIALALVLGTYRLATRFTRSPLLAALCALLTPGVMVSAASVMCDTMMLALWVWAALLWIEGLETGKRWLLIVSSVLMGASALTKYFGVSIVLLVLAYSLFRLRRVGFYLVVLLIPVALLPGYEWWTDNLYGHGLLQTAAEFARSQRAGTNGSSLAMLAVGLSFVGGCSLMGLCFGPFVWSRKQIAIGIVVGGIVSWAVVAGWIDMGLRVGHGPDNPWLTGVQLLFCIAGGFSILGLAVKDLAQKRDAESLFLGLWVGGTFFFAGFVNYAVNARSVLPLIPAAAILVARQLDLAAPLSGRRQMLVAIALVVSMMVSFWITYADSELADSARHASALVFEKTHGKGGKLFFEGHWGFQYYMQAGGAEPLDLSNPQATSGDFVVIPHNNIQTRSLEPSMLDSEQALDLPLKSGASTISSQLGAGFYSSYWGPLPFAFGRVPMERYELSHLLFQRDGSGAK